MVLPEAWSSVPPVKFPYNQNNMQHINHKGFTLIETIVAITILITAIIGPFTLASQTLRAQAIAKNNLVAANLAQEGIELIRNRRSNNILRNESAENPLDHWLDGTTSCGGDPSNAPGCGIDVFSVDDADLASCNSQVIASCLLFRNPQTGIYAHGGAIGTETNFARHMYVEAVNLPGDPPEARIIAIIVWRDQYGSQRFVLSTRIFNW